LWLLDPEVAHLNHGAFGAVPVPVLRAQQAASEAVERSPEAYYRDWLMRAVVDERTQVAEFLGVAPDGLVLVRNATEALQVALDAIGLRAGAAIVYTDHAYVWVKAAIAWACERYGSVARCVPLPVAKSGEVPADQLVHALKRAIDESTAVVILDQITSASALRLPVEEVVAELGDSVPIIIDGAHAPGLIERPVPEKAAFWFGNLHKWAFAARTAAALVVAPAWRERTRPLVASAGASLGFPESFTYLGTQGNSAYLSLHAALEFPVQHLAMTFPELVRRNAEVLARGLAILNERSGARESSTSALPMGVIDLGISGDDAAASALADKLRGEGVEVAIVSSSGRLKARISVQAYVGLEDFEHFAAVLEQVL